MTPSTRSSAEPIALRRRFGDRAWRRFAADERGFFTALQCLAVLFFTVLCLTVLHIGATVTDKLALQNAADAAARSAAVEIARGLNVLAAVQHLAGETLAMIAVHEAIGGPSPGGSARDTREVDLPLQAAFNALRAMVGEGPPELTGDEREHFLRMAQGFEPFAFDTVGQPVRYEATVLEVQTELKRLLTGIYAAKLAALVSGNWQAAPPLNLQESLVLQDYRLLNALGSRAAARLPDVRTLRTRVIPDLRATIEQVVAEYPAHAEAMARHIALQNGAAEVHFARDLRLPVMRDPLATAQNAADLRQAIPDRWYGPRLPTEFYAAPADVPRVAIDRKQIVKVTQLCRAAFPWVNYHREPIRRYLKRCVLVDAEKIYTDQSYGSTVRLCDNLQRSDRLVLYVMPQATLPDKGYEAWTDDPALADAACGLLAVVERPARLLPGGAYLAGPAGERPRYAFAQALLYNAHDQVRHARRIDLRTKRLVPERQPRVGWDTLQWAPNAAGKMPFELVAKGTFEPLTPEQPRIAPAWHAKLVGASRPLLEAVAVERPDLAAKMGWPTSWPDALLTH